jgi:hypothetical protein
MAGMDLATSREASMSVNITEKEAKMLRNIAENDYANGEPSAWVWADCLDCGPEDLPIASHGGLIASLSKKDLAYSDGAGYCRHDKRDQTCVRLTEKGLAAWRAMGHSA